mgnify:CR=1 FL=1
MDEYAPSRAIFIDEIHRLSPVVEEILYPAQSWPSEAEYWSKYRQLAARYIDNFKKFAPATPPEVQAAGPSL